MPHLASTYDDTLTRGILPESFCESVLVTFPKPHRDPTLPASYRPITLLNADCKILGKLLANRYSQILPALVHPDQCGFVPRFNTSHNLRRLFHIQDRVKDRFPLAACLILDLEKAFNTLTWPPLFEVPWKINIGPTLMAYTKLLYRGVTSRVRVSKLISAPFPVERGTRRGAPSPPSFLHWQWNPWPYDYDERGKHGVSR